jgi:hypothetical protein
MANSKAAVKQSDITRALKAARDAGFEVAQFEVGQNGELHVYFDSHLPDANRNEWDVDLRIQ